MTTSARTAHPHPGAILQREFLTPLGLSGLRLATHLNVRENTIYPLLKGERPITAELALRLARFFGTSPRMWMHAQAHYDLRQCEDEMGAQIEEDVVPVLALGNLEQARAGA